MTGEDAKMNCRIIEGADQINTDEIVKLLRTTYWANKRSKEQIRNPWTTPSATVFSLTMNKN